MNLKNLFKPIQTIPSIAMVFVLCFIIPTLLIPVSEDLLKSINPKEMQLFLPLLIIFSLYISITYFLLIENTDQKRTTLLIQLLLAHLIMYPVMGLLESLFWSDAFKGVDLSEFFGIFLRFIITFSLFSGFLATIAKRRTSSLQIPKQVIDYKQAGIKILLIGLTYFVIYNLFGYFIAWQFEATRAFYTGSIENIGFIPSMWQNVSNPTFLLVHTFRGILFGIAGFIFYNILECSKAKKIIIMSLLFGGFGFQIVLPNPLLPEMVRISHFIETTSSMLLFGAVVGLIFSAKIRILFPATLIILLLSCSCQIEPPDRFGFDTNCKKSSQSFVNRCNMSNVKTVGLIGNIVICKGEMLIALNNPSGKVLFKSRIKAPDVLHVNESFQASKRNWSVKYSGIEREANLVLRLNIVS